MKLATGVDLIEIARIKEVMARHGKHYLERVFTPAELEQFGKRAESLAGRFAAKEAVSKALGCGIGEVTWKEIEILGDDQNAPVLTLHGTAEQQGKGTWANDLVREHQSQPESLRGVCRGDRLKKPPTG